MNPFYFLIILVMLTMPGCLSFAASLCNTGQWEKKECVILLHGLRRTSNSMRDMADALQRKGYWVINVNYPSTAFTVEELALKALSPAVAKCRKKGIQTVNVVTHSMGGILLRYYLSQRSILGLKRVVMLSPPNQGSEVVDALKDNIFFNWYNGPAGRQLGTGPDGIAAKLGPVTYPVGIITGNKHSFFDAYFARLIPGEDDGKVAVERAKVDGMADFIVLAHAHTFIMQQKEVILQTLYFLKHGNFHKKRF